MLTPPFQHPQVSAALASQLSLTSSKREDTLKDLSRLLDSLLTWPRALVFDHVSLGVARASAPLWEMLRPLSSSLTIIIIPSAGTPPADLGPLLWAECVDVTTVTLGPLPIGEASAMAAGFGATDPELSARAAECLAGRVEMTSTLSLQVSPVLIVLGRGSA
jgi:hypothetical protein